eukprot:TRINITY_DN13609_c0_g1_i3.p1 TRINITY_DN13609_c0_g1~~TRINITY_DN13609_c0_g1_i3.p1  ORF type:complete len:333 (-),score=57.56 TRINITY_DN13609_c0_g1_i3:10-1008(-)
MAFPGQKARRAPSGAHLMALKCLNMAAVAGLDTRSSPASRKARQRALPSGELARDFYQAMEQRDVRTPQSTCNAQGSFVVSLSSLSGEEVSLTACANDTVAHVRKLAADALGLPAYRVTLSDKQGQLKAKNTLAQHGIFDDVQLFVVIGEENRWQELSQKEFVELVAARGLDNKENMRWSLQQPQYAGPKGIQAFRQQYIPDLQRLLEREEREQRRRDAARAMSESVARQVEVLVIELGIPGAIEAISDKIVDVDATVAAAATSAQEVRAQCGNDLNATGELLQETAQSVNCLCKADLNELRAFPFLLCKGNIVGLLNGSSVFCFWTFCLGS